MSDPAARPIGPRSESDEGDELESLAGYLKALSHPSRLELLSQLRVPRSLNEIRLHPQRNEVEGNPDRLISRTAAEKHLSSLRAIGVVVRRAAERDGRAVDEYVLHQPRLFQVVEELRALSQLRPLDPIASEQTVGDVLAVRAVESKVAHCVLLSGPTEGRVFELKSGDRWAIGRSASARICLDYDPYVSSEHAYATRDPNGELHLHDVPTSRNGTLVNWARLPRGGSRPLRSGDVIRVGRSLILFRAADG